MGLKRLNPLMVAALPIGKASAEVIFGTLEMWRTVARAKAGRLQALDCSATPSATTSHTQFNALQKDTIGCINVTLVCSGRASETQLL
jgi:hypothetical protein